MKLRIIATTFLLVLTLVPLKALAVPGGVRASGGAGFVMLDGEVERTNINGEFALYYSLAILTLDLGLLMDMEQPDEQIQLRPGAHLKLPFLYLRGAIPIDMKGNNDWGFLVGVGKMFSIAPVLGFFIELDTTIYGSQSPSDVWPFEARLGVELGF